MLLPRIGPPVPPRRAPARWRRGVPAAGLGVALLGVLLAACAPSGEEASLSFADAASSLIGLSGDPLPFGDACAVDGFELPGQGFRHAGSVGGLIMDASVSPAAVPEAFEKSYAAFFAGSTPARDGAIVVVDDFGPGVYTLGDAVFRQRAADNLDPDKLEVTLDALEVAGDLAHGPLVSHHVNALLLGTGAYKPLSVTPGEVVWEEVASGRRLVVMAVNIADANRDTASIATLTEAGLERLDEVFGIDRAVVNMSFILLPCGLIDDAEASGHDSFQGYMSALAVLNRLSYDELIAAVIAAVDDPADPLFNLVLTPNGRGERHLYVASSGNYGLDFPMLPAAWPDVVAVTGSSFGDSLTRDARLFNAGAVMQVGEWFTLERLDALYGPVVQPGDPMFYAGTSFSTPTVSVFSALDLMSASPRCAAATGPSLLTGADDTDDLWLDDAAAKYCP